MTVSCNILTAQKGGVPVPIIGPAQLEGYLEWLSRQLPQK